MHAATGRVRRIAGAVLAALVVGAWLWSGATAHAQGVTTGSMAGLVTDDSNQPIAAAGVTAIHLPSGSVYETVTRADGRFSIPGMRVGGPYSVTVFYGDATAATVFEPQTQDNVTVNLGVSTDLVFVVASVTVAEEVTVTAQSDPVFSSGRTGAATALSREALSSLPTVGQRLQDITRLTPQAGPGLSFAGQDNRLNNITVDGSYFNNSFGLAGTTGRSHRRRADLARRDRAGAGQRRAVRRAPGQLRRRGVNTVTRSGGQPVPRARSTTSSATRPRRHRGQGPGGSIRAPSVPQHGRLGVGADHQEQAVLLRNYENEAADGAGHDVPGELGGEAVGWRRDARARIGPEPSSQLPLVATSTTTTGPFQGYDQRDAGGAVPREGRLQPEPAEQGQRPLQPPRLRHRCAAVELLVARVRQPPHEHDGSQLPELELQDPREHPVDHRRVELRHRHSMRTASSSATPSRTRAATRSARSSRWSTSSRAASVYTTFGFEPFTPNNELRYNTFQFQNNFTKFSNKHTLHLRSLAERYESENVFFPGSQSAYVVQLARGLLRRRKRLPREPESHDIAGDAAALPGPVDEHPWPRQARAAARGVLLGSLRPGRVAREGQLHADRRPAIRRAPLR
jgi:hypothetical protein